MSNKVIQTLIYLVNSEFILLKDVNNVQTHYYVSELENAVDLMEHIDTLYT